MRALLLIVVAIVLVGCARRYKVTLTNGSSFTTASKPKLNAARNAYIYKDQRGQEAWVSAGRVVEISAE